MACTRTIQTERLVLSPYSVDDFDDLARLWGDERVTRHIGKTPNSEEQTWSQVLRSIGHWAVLDYGFWTLRERSSGDFVGEVGFSNHRRAIKPALGDAPEMGWAIAPHFQKRGFAREAARAALTWADGKLGQRVVCMIHPENSASIQLATAFNFAEFATTEYRGGPVILFERLL